MAEGHCMKTDMVAVKLMGLKLETQRCTSTNQQPGSKVEMVRLLDTSFRVFPLADIIWYCIIEVAALSTLPAGPLDIW